MSSWRKIYFKSLNLAMKLFVRSKVIPADPARELGLNLAWPVLYVLPYKSKTDLLTLRTQCLSQNLPDPINPLKINGLTLSSYVFIYKGLHLSRHYIQIEESAKLFHAYLDLHHSNPQLNIQVLPVFVMFGRSPRYRLQETLCLRMLSSVQKIFAVLWLGRDSLIYFSKIVSLRHIACKYGTDKAIANKLARIARMHFARQRLAAVGPIVPARQDLLKKLLSSRAIKTAVLDEAHGKKISFDQARRKAIVFLEEIAADFSHETVRFADRVLRWTWNRLYQGINVTNVERVRQLAQSGHEIVYTPCHRSHMDYLLLSYVLYRQGLVPPHIAAGINLNFWPAGPIFRRLGAFFIRRTFRGNKLYSTIFREYLSELFTCGYSVEYFVEGGRSRTGRLLAPKTGTLSMTMQGALRRCGARPITLVPIYIGYEHVIEVGTYVKELQGANKEKENFFQMLRGFLKLRNLGQGYVNFGDPLPLVAYLNQYIPKWRESIDPTETQRPIWLTPAVNNLAIKIMVRINNAASANAINLCATALLASKKYSLTRKQLLEQLNCYLQLILNAPYANNVTVPKQTPDELLSHALSMNKFKITKDKIDDIITLPLEQAMLMAYYSNNIHHLLVLPSLVAAILIHHKKVSFNVLIQKISLIYPLLKAELFMPNKKENLIRVLHPIIKEMVRQKLIYYKNKALSLNQKRLYPLQLLAATVRENLQRYAIAMSILIANPSITRAALEKESLFIAQHLSMIYSINAPEFFDKAVFSALTGALREEGYMNNTDHALCGDRALKFYTVLSDLITKEITLTIESFSISLSINVKNKKI